MYASPDFCIFSISLEVDIRIPNNGEKLQENVFILLDTMSDLDGAIITGCLNWTYRVRCFETNTFSDFKLIIILFH